MAKILALDTSSEACSVALLNDQQVFELHELVPRQHTQKLLPMVDEVLNQASLELAELDGIAFGAGPGSFTGLRITAGVAQGLAFGADLPLFPISTLAALAQEAYRERQAESILATLDARMGEVYWGVYQLQGGIMQASQAERVCAPEDVSIDADISGDWFGIGSGWNLQQQMPSDIVALANTIAADRQPRACFIAELAAQDLIEGKGKTAEAAQPVYLRDEVAWKKSNHRQQ
jgi:tRNA threonylcarbamoyladenosine biosynthesis protein TsaB